MKIFSPILKGTTTVAQGTTNLSGSFTGSLLGTAATASYADNFTVGGTLTAQTINVQIITSSIEFNTGSTRNGSSTANTHQFTGSVLMSGSLTVNNGNTLNIYRTDNTRALQLYTTNDECVINSWEASSEPLHIRSMGSGGRIQFFTSGSERMRITSAGNVGIGVIPSGMTAVSGIELVQGSQISSRTLTNVPQLYLSSNIAGDPFEATYKVSGYATQYRIQGYDGTHTWYTAPIGTAGNSITLTERMRITNTGNVGIGTTSPSSKLHVVTTGTSFTPTATGQIGGNTPNRVHIQSNEPGLMLSSDSNGSGSPTGTQTYQLGLQIGVYTTNDIRNQIYFGNTLLSFVYSGDQGSTASERMRISTNGSIGAPNGTNIYNASDIRLKQNVSTTTYGLNTISALNPVKFNWVDGFEPTEDGKDMLGFIAQEMQNVIPEAIESFGGNSITIGDTVIDNPLRVNEKFIIPVLVKAIQELSAKNTSLEERLTALENN